MKITVEFYSKDESTSSFEDRLENVLSAFICNFKIVNVIPSDQLTIEIIENCVCNFFACKPKDLQKKSRKREVVRMRQLCHYLSSEYLKGVTLGTIGFYFGKKDHSTVSNSVKTVKNLLETNIQFQNEFRSFIESFK
ncbi:MAG TPA: helix-turn-helix domain-containing protein [Paludibacter sp.]